MNSDDGQERLLARFLKKIEIQDDGCWKWTAAMQGRGYGYIVVGSRIDDSRRMVLAHRLAYEIFVGPIPKNDCIDHLCRNRACVNPEHLEAVTLAENLRRGMGWSGVNARKTHCVNGHELAGDNLYLWRDRRYCRACRKERLLRRAAARES